MKSNFKDLVYTVGNTIGKYTPEILTGLGIAGMISTTIMAVSATPKAIKLCDEIKSEKENPKTMDYVKTAWKCYIPAAVTCTLSTACLIGANSVNHRRTAAIATAYKLSESALTDYREKVIDMFGNDKDKEVRDNIYKDKVEKANVVKQEVIITDSETNLCYDVISGRVFRSSVNALQKVVNDLNRRMRDEMYISLNEFYSEIGLPNTSIGDDLGWNINRGYIDLSFSAQLINDTPCLVVYYVIEPKYDYSRI